MTAENEFHLADFDESSIAAVHLLSAATINFPSSFAENG